MSEQHDSTQRPSRIPEFATKEEEARFWDIHSFVDYLDELEPVDIRFAKNLSNSSAARHDSLERTELIRRGKRQDLSS